MYVSRKYVIEINYPEELKTIELPTERIVTYTYTESKGNGSDRLMIKVAAFIGSVVTAVIATIIKFAKTSHAEAAQDEEAGEEG